MKRLTDTHQQFAAFFPDQALHPYFYLLSKKLADGHICIPVSELENETLPESYPGLLSKPALLKRDMVAEEKAAEPIVYCKGNIYLQRYFVYETRILQRIKSFAEQQEQSAVAQKLLNNKKSIIAFFANSSAGINWQLAAALTAVTGNFTIITGGPGTGKTTTVAKALAVLFTIFPENLRVALAAPTGKAASRMAEALKNAGKNLPAPISEKLDELEPATIHRLLHSKKNSPYFVHDSKNPIPYDVVIADESSMIDVALFSKLLAAIPDNARIILLGDKNQLAAVEAGSLFGDLCDAVPETNLFSKDQAELLNNFIEPADAKFEYLEDQAMVDHPLFSRVIELKHSHRFNIDGGIGKFSAAIIANEQEIIQTFFSNNDPAITITSPSDDASFFHFAEKYFAYINEPDIQSAIRKLNQYRVLCAVREGSNGLYQVNKRIENYLHAKKMIRTGPDFYENMPLMVTANNYELELYNGDIGIVRKDEKGLLKLWFEQADGTLRSVSPAYVNNAEKVYAMTIHKSQGSEFDEILILLPALENNKILTRELLYTGVTRARNKVTLMAEQEIILQTATSKVKRSSGLKERLQEID